MELVPFCSELTGSETKLDLKAIYRRPCATGVSLTSPYPLRRHSDQVAKGFEYVTLASMDDLGQAAGLLRAKGYDPLAMRSSYDRQGHFKIAEYLQQAKAADAAHLADLQAKVDKFGAEAVVEMMRVSDPAFVLPASIVTDRKAGKK
jgi:hypothetical protein